MQQNHSWLADMELYFAPTPNGWKITILLAELGLPYQLKPVDLAKGEQFSKQFLQMNPNHRIPVLVDPQGPNGEPITLFESGAIMVWLADKTGRFLAPESAQRYRALQWLFWQVGGLGPMAGQLSHFVNYAPGEHPYSLERYSLEYERLLAVMQLGLEKADWLGGEYSIADMACFPWVIPYKRFGKDLSRFPAVRDWFDRMKERPAVRQGVDVGKELRQTRGDESSREQLFGQSADRLLKESKS